MTYDFFRTASLKRTFLAAGALALAAGVSQAQIVDHQVPLNYNFHGMAHQSEAITGATSSNADFINYRSISDRGLYWDPSDQHAFGTNPLIGFTGINYGLFDTLGYGNETALPPGDAQTNALDMVHLGGRGVWFRLYDTDGATINGPFPFWQPDPAHNSDHTGDQVTILGSPITVDAQTEIGVLYMVSDSGGQFDCVLTFNNGSTDTNVTARLKASDWFGAAADPTINSGQPISSQKKITHTVAGTTYTTFRGVQNTDSAALQAFLTTNAGPNLNVTEGIISVPMIVAAGNNVVGQQLTRITFRNALWSTTQTLTALSGDGTTATATCSGNAGFNPGMPVTISGATPAGFNGTYTVTSMGPSNTITSITSSATAWTVTTANAHGFVAANPVYIAGASPAVYNGTFTVGTVIDANNFTITNATNPGPASGTMTLSNPRIFNYANSTVAATTTGTRSALAVGRDRGYSIYGVTARTGAPQRANCSTADVIGVGDTVSNNIRCGGAVASGYGNNDTTAAWYSYTATTTGDIEARTCGAAIDTTIAVLNTCGGSPIAGNDNGGCGTGSRVRWSAIVGHNYLIRVSGNLAATGNFTLHIDDPAHVDILMPLAFNWNGIVNGQNEQTLPDPAGTTFENRCDLNGYRSIADRGLLCDGVQTNALNYGGGAVGYNGMFYTVYGADHQADMIHLGNRCGGLGRCWSVNCPLGDGTGPGQNGLRPSWLSQDEQLSASSDLSAFGAVFGPNTMIGLLYHVSNVGAVTTLATFDVVLTFTDSTSVTVTPQATDWFGSNTQVLIGHNNTDGYGLETQRVLGIYHGTQNTDRASDAPAANALKVDEAVISSASLQNIGFNAVGKTLASITFQNPRSGNTAHDTSSSGFGIYSTTLRDPASYNQNFGPSGIAGINLNPVTVGSTARMQVAVSRGGGVPNNITSVTINASSINQGTIVLNDGGANGDVNPNDSTWSRTVVFPVNSTPGNAHLPFTVTDGQNRTFVGDLSFGINGVTGTATPGSVAQSGSTLITVPLFPHTGAGTDITQVSINASSISSGTLALNDSGADGDVTAGDGIWSGTLAVYGGATLGAATLPIHVQDTSARVNDNGTVALTITAAPSGRCCTSGTCSITTAFNCTQGGGVYGGDGSDCGNVTYTLSTSATPYATISGSGQLVTNASNVDDGGDTVQLPFTFNFYGTDYSSVWVCSNGFLQFGGANTTTFGNIAIPATAAPTSAIFALWDDLNTLTQGDVYWQVDGIAPNRTLTVDWANVSQYIGAGGTVNSENFEVVLYETSNNIELRYGTLDACNDPGQCTGTGADGDDRTIGIQNNAGTSAVDIGGLTIGSGNVSKRLTFAFATNPCGGSTGSCCTINRCTTTSQSDCATLGGTWSSGGTCPASCVPHCGSADFNCDGDIGTDSDIGGFFACLSGNCPALPCISSADFNGDGDIGTDQDIEAFFRVLSGGGC